MCDPNDNYWCEDGPSHSLFIVIAKYNNLDTIHGIGSHAPIDIIQIWVCYP